jgi:hypothetical protein
MTEATDNNRLDSLTIWLDLICHPGFYAYRIDITWLHKAKFSPNKTSLSRRLARENDLRPIAQPERKAALSGMNVGPEHFVDAAHRCLEKVKRALDPRTKSVLMARARALRQTAIKFTRSLAIHDNLLRFLLPVSNLNDLERELSKLKAGRVVRLPRTTFTNLVENRYSETTTILMLLTKYDCEMQFNGDEVAFVKREHSWGHAVVIFLAAKSPGRKPDRSDAPVECPEDVLSSLR